MPVSEIVWGQWLPDLAPNGHNALTVCQNVYPIENGYAPVGALADALAPLNGWAGGAAFMGAGGGAVLLSGNATGLHRYSGAGWVQVHAGGGRWYFAQNLGYVIAVNGGVPVSYDLTAGAAAVVEGAPSSKYVATVAPGFTFYAGNPTDVRKLTWSDIAAPLTLEGGASGSMDLPEGGAITGIAGGEFGLVFQRDKIHRFDYVGGPTTFNRAEISKNTGCIAAGSIAQAGRLTFFLSERGFMKTDGNDAVPIGHERVDRTFLAAHRSGLDAVQAATDPRHFLVYWLIPGNPGRIYCYNYVQDRWSLISMPLSGLCSAYTSNISSDALDAVYPGGADAQTLTMDSPLFAGGEPRFYVVSPEGSLGTLTGPNLPAKLQTAFGELAAGRHTRVSLVRPMGDSVDGVTVTIDARRRLGDREGKRERSIMRASGNIPVRSQGRAMALTLETDLAAKWNYQQGVAVTYAAGGLR